MKLNPKEEERLTVFMAAELARRRKDRGVALNHPESVAYVSDWAFERARDGWSVAKIRSEASQLLSTDDVMEGVPEMVDTIQVEPTFPDGTKLVTIHDPIRSAGARGESADASDEAAVETEEDAEVAQGTGDEAEP